MQNQIARVLQAGNGREFEVNRDCIQSQWGMCRSRPQAKIHPRPRRGCKVCLKPGSHIGPAMAAGSETRRGETRSGVHGRGDGAAGRSAARGNSHSHSPVAVEGARARGSPRTYRRQCRKMRCAGQLANALRGVAEERRCGETRRFISCDAEGWGIRGASKLHRRYSGKMRAARKLADALGSWTGRCLIRATCEFIAIEASEIPESLAPLFVVGLPVAFRRFTHYSQPVPQVSL